MSDPLDKLIPKAVDKAVEEAITPSARALGATLGSAVKTALRPVDGLVWSLDRAFDWVAQRVTAFLAARGTDPAAIRKPAAEVQARVVLALRTAGPSNDPTLRNLFAALLATSMTSQEKPRFHPSFLNVLSLLTPYEARLVAIAASRPVVVVNSTARLSWGQLFKADASTAPDLPAIDILRVPYGRGVPNDPHAIAPHVPLSTIHKDWNFLPDSLGLDTLDLGFALRNLERHGIIEQGYISGVDSAPEKLHDATFTEAYREYLAMRDEYRRVAQNYRDENPGVPLDIDESFGTETFRVTIWGADFARACATTDFYDDEQREFCLPGWAA